MNWFEGLTGFVEKSPAEVYANMCLDAEFLKSNVNGRKWRYGKLETPTLAELRQRIGALEKRQSGKLHLKEVVADVQSLHSDPANSGALFQVASQFNLLEMASPTVTPEDGVSRYAYDHTQGPACAIAAGAGTIYRNYFADVNGQTGQTADNQIDCLAEMGQALGNHNERLWKMKNGYALASQEGLADISERLTQADLQELDTIRQQLRIGIQWNTEVTINGEGQLVSQAYCSALPVAYSRVSSQHWESFACLVLEASYEATFCAAILNAVENKCGLLYLTMLGGGAFGNKTSWITAAIRRAVELYAGFNLDVAIVSFSRSNPAIAQLVQDHNPAS